MSIYSGKVVENMMSRW